MARDLASLETELGKLDSDLDGEAGKVFDAMESVRAKAPDVFKRTHARVAAKAQMVERVDKLLTSLDRANQNPTSAGSSAGSASSSDQASVDSAEKKSPVT